jgi:hypothetical protein
VIVLIIDDQNLHDLIINGEATDLFNRSEMVGLLYDLPSPFLSLCLFFLLYLHPPLSLVLQPTLIRLRILLSLDPYPVIFVSERCGLELNSFPCPV